MPIRTLRRIFPLYTVFVLALLAGTKPASLTPEIERAIEHISAASLRGHLSFLASDLLEGRGTPSRGLDMAAEYIAAQFRRAGLEPAGDDGYFQTASLQSVRQQMEGFELTVDGPKPIRARQDHASIITDRALDLSQVPVFKADASTIGSLKPDQVAGKAVVVALSPDETFSKLRRQLSALEPAVVLDTAWKEFPPERLVDPSQPASAPWIVLRDSDLVHVFHAAKPGLTDLRVSLHLQAPQVTPAPVRNVVGIVRGADPVLKNTYVLVTAHYDHLGIAGGRIFHGANDDGSGTVSVVEIGQALAALEPHPRRTVVFMTFFGEEEGSLGALYYMHHPLFPLNQTVADLNLEQLGRTDSSAGPEVANATLTGYDYSDLSTTLREAGKLTGIRVYRSEDGGDPYFNRSDNIVFARAGIPAHTIVVAYEYPDYHAPGDTWQKIDYNNLAKVDRMIAVATILIAEHPDPPHWNANNPKAAPYRQHTD